MKKFFLFFVILFVLFNNIFISSVLAQDVWRDAPQGISKFIGVTFGVPWPGLECGVAGGKDGIDKCCAITATEKMTNPGVFDNPIMNSIDYLLSNFPIFGSLFTAAKEPIRLIMERNNQLLDLKNKYTNDIQCVYGTASGTGVACICQADKPADLNKAMAQLCYKYLQNSQEMPKCLSCAASNKMYTALGCIPLNLQSFVSDYLLSVGVGLGGVVALLCIIYSAIMMQTSQGNPEKIKKAQEMLTSCIMGLMLIIFSVFILRLIGVDILKIPGLSSK